MSGGDNWLIPEELSADGRKAAEVIHGFLVEKRATYHGGGGKFYSPQQWLARGELYGVNSLLIVTHDGGDHAPYFNLDYEAYEGHEELRKRLDDHGLWMEQCTSWYSAAYKL